jgi:GTP-binding protein
MERLPRVVILGFPNVGKSSLFNRLVREKKSLVHNLPGMTRDTVTAVCRLDGRSFLLTDTGGFFGEEERLSAKVQEKAWDMARRADVILFVLDGRRGLLPGEEELCLSLRKLGRPLFIVVNKIDTPSQEDTAGDFFRLGAKGLFLVSAEHKRNIEPLSEALVGVLPASGAVGEASTASSDEALRIALVGRINVGKSSLANRLCGEERLIVSEIPGTTRDSSDILLRRDRKTFCLVDTAGLRKLGRARDVREKAGIIKAKKNIGQADVICLIMDALECPTRQDAAVAQIAQESGKPLILAVNKWDLVPKDRRTAEEFRARILTRLDFVNYAPLIFVSAVSGQRVVKILDLAEDVYASARRRIETSKLNSFLAEFVADHPAVGVSKRRIKLKYMTQQGVLPPTFILFSHSADRLATGYEKFFISRLRERFDFWGTPVRVFLKVS